MHRRKGRPNLLDDEFFVKVKDVMTRGVLKSMEWSKRKGTNGKIESSKQFLLKEKLTFQRRIASIIEEHNIPKELILNLYQIPSSNVSHGKYTFNPKGAKKVPIKGIR